MAHNPSDSAALNVANPPGVGGYVLRMPDLGESEKGCTTIGAVGNGKMKWSVHGDPNWAVVTAASVRRDPLLGGISAQIADSFGTGWVSNVTDATPQPRFGPGRLVSARTPQIARPNGVQSGDRDQQGPQIKGPAMSDKSPRSSMTKKSGKSLKEKRAVKRAKEDHASQTEAVLHPKKR
jgi:hypothetical protein